MTDQEYERLNRAAAEGTIQDDKNPIFLFACTNTVLLRKIVQGQIDAREMASRELENRGIPYTPRYSSHDAKGNRILVTIPE